MSVMFTMIKKTLDDLYWDDYSLPSIVGWVEEHPNLSVSDHLKLIKKAPDRKPWFPISAFKWRLKYLEALGFIENTGSCGRSNWCVSKDD